MRYSEIVIPISHPYFAIIAIDPADFATFERLVRDCDEVCVLGRVTSPNVWTLHLGCVSQWVADQIMDA